MNLQPWAFVVASKAADAEGHRRILERLVPMNRSWAQNAPVLMVAVARLKFARNGQPNAWAQYDTGQAVAQLVLEATSLGLAVHQMGGFDASKAVELLNLPDGHQPLAVLAIGYPGDADDLSAEMQARESAARHRKTVDEFILPTSGPRSTVLQ